MLVIIVVITTASISKYRNNLQDQRVKTQTYRTELKQLNIDLEKIKQQDKKDKQDNADSQQQIQQSEQQIQQLQQDKQDLQDQLQARAEEKAKIELAAKSITISTKASAESVTGCGDNSYANYIYTHESGCRLSVTNAEGCIGIGQACPASKLISACPDLDYACENAFFTNYAVSRYGSWQGAYNAWLQKHWW